MKQSRYTTKIPKPIGYLLLAFCMVGSATIPGLSILNPKSFTGIANSSLPYGVPRIAFEDLTDEALFKAIIDNGAQIILVKQFDPEPIKNTAGLWNPSNGTMILKSGSFTHQQYMRVMKHEAIHMAQSCKNNFLKAEPTRLGLPITQQGLKALEPYKQSNPDYYLSEIEREAHSNDTRSYKFIVNLLNEHCGSRPWIRSSGRIRSIIQSAFLPRSLKRTRESQEKSR